MAEALSNTNKSILFTPQSSGIPSQNGFTEIQQKSTKVKTLNNEILVTVWVDIQPGTCQNTNPIYTHITGSGSISATSQKCLCEQQQSLRENDSGTCNGTFVSKKDGSIINCTCSVKIQNAGQFSATCE